MGAKEKAYKRKLDKAGEVKLTLIPNHCCLDCLKLYKRTIEGKKARTKRNEDGAWGKGKWPESAWTDTNAKRCTHHTAIRRDLTSRRRAAELQATPKWADKAAIKAVYELAVKIERETGIPQHVDHKIPLRGKLVCGLHVHYNLEVLPQRENLKKSNQFSILDA